MTAESAPTPQLYAGVVGQDRAIALLRAAAARPVHAYLLVGPAGTGKAVAASSFAASLLCPTAGNHTTAELCDSCRRVIEGLHPDVVNVEREGASISMGAAREVTRSAFMSPVEGERKVIILHDFHLVRDTGPALLKTLEEPPPSTVFVVLAEYLPPELTTIASRCVTVGFDPLSPRQVVEALIAAGVEADRAQALADASGGRLERARLLATDPRFEVRRRTWHEIPTRLDGSMATAAAVADELAALLDESVLPLKEQQARELETLTARNARNAEVVGSGRAAKGRARATKAALNAGVADLEERQRREQRRLRTDELRTGMAVLAGAYRERLSDGIGTERHRRAAAIEAIGHVDRAVRNLQYNPGELLLLQALLARLSRRG